VRAALAKTTVEGQRATEDVETAVQQLVSKAISSNQVIDLFAAAGLRNPDISILSDEFMAEVRNLPHRNLALELLRKLIQGELKTRSRKNVVQARAFSEMLEQSILRYQNRAIDTVKVIDELIRLAKEMKAAASRGQELGLTDDELAFYDALEVNDSAVQVLGDQNLRIIAKELVETVKRNATIDWTVRENVRARLRVMVKRVLKKHGYPPDKQERATATVLQQAEVLGRDWAGALN
jgi:type I restriction enzyme, R subunit